MSMIHLIRHGRTLANDKHLYCGSTDLPLSTSGIAELERMHWETKNVRFVTSGMKRTEQTLRILFGSVPHRVEPRLREIDFGIFEMRGYEQLKDNPSYQQWIGGDNESNVPPEGESGKQMRLRVLQALEEIMASGQETVIITHGGVIAVIMEYLFPKDGKNRYQWQPRPGHGYSICGDGYRLLP